MASGEYNYDAEAGGIKTDQGKVRPELLPTQAMMAIAEVMTRSTFPEGKYPVDNWRKGMSWRRVYGSLLRHLYAWEAGEDNDEESGLLHLAHAGACLVFLLTYQLLGLGTDDRPSTATHEEANAHALAEMARTVTLRYADPETRAYGEVTVPARPTPLQEAVAAIPPSRVLAEVAEAVRVEMAEPTPAGPHSVPDWTCLGGCAVPGDQDFCPEHGYDRRGYAVCPTCNGLWDDGTLVFPCGHH